MTETQAVNPVLPGDRTAKFTAFLFGAVAYFTLLFTILYAIRFVSGFAVAKTIDTGVKSGIVEAIVVNLVLMSLLAIQHSVMAHKWCKQSWTRFIPGPVERGIHLLLASITLFLPRAGLGAVPMAQTDLIT